MEPLRCAEPCLVEPARAFLGRTAWAAAACEPLTGDASTRRYFRLRLGPRTAILMDASHNLESVKPFLQIDRHLDGLGFSVPAMLAHEEEQGFLLLEDFGDDTFTRLLDNGHDPERLYALATDVLVALHRQPQAIPPGLRAYHPPKMLEDLEMFLDWCAPAISEAARAEFRAAWRGVLPLAHQVPASLLLRDYHVANLMRLPGRTGLRQVGLLDFQDAYQGPIAYDLVSLLEDARREVPLPLRERMVARYLGNFPDLDPAAFSRSLAILAALRHTRVLGIFERLWRYENKPDFKASHSPRVKRRLQRALTHPELAEVKRWFEAHAW